MKLGMLLWILGIIAFDGLTSTTALSNAHLAPLPNGSVICSPDVVKINLTHDYVATFGLPSISRILLASNLSDPYSANDSCIATNTSTGYEFCINATSGECSFAIILNGTMRTLFYSIRVKSSPLSDVISRYPRVDIRTSCAYDGGLTVDVGGGHSIVSATSPLQPIAKEKKIKVEPDRLDFHVSMSLTGSSVSPSYSVLVGSGVFMSASINAPLGSNLVLQVQKCWATPTKDPRNNCSFDIIENGCAAPDPVSSAGGNVVVLNFQGLHVIFGFAAFLWKDIPLNSQCIYIHCDFTVCSPDAENNCTDSPCDRRRRRSLDMEKMRVESTKSVTFGPINVSNKPHQAILSKPADNNDVIARGSNARFCDKNKMGCSYQCATTSELQTICICPLGFALHHNGKGCYEAKAKTQHHHTKKIFADSISFPVIFIIAAVMSCLLLLFLYTTSA